MHVNGHAQNETRQPLQQTTAPNPSPVVREYNQPNSTPTTEIVIGPSREAYFMPAMSLDVALARRSAIVAFVAQLMVKDQDFGVIPGTKKPTLLKPGAEKLCNFFGLEPEFTPIAEEADWTGDLHYGEPFHYVRYRCRLLRDGRVLGVGEGSCNSWESRYRYRWMPEDQVPEHLDKSKLLTRGGRISEFSFAIEQAQTTGQYGKPASHWKQFTDAIDAGTATQIRKKTMNGREYDAWEIDGRVFRVPNPDVADLVNTIQKIAQKRALIAAALIATSASEFFTQDVEDIPLESVAAKEPESNVPAKQTERKPPAQAAVRPPWKNQSEMKEFFSRVREQVGEVEYMNELGKDGVDHFAKFKSAKAATECFNRLYAISKKQGVA